jgi:hypothetical protein
MKQRLLELLHAAPFIPFTIHLADGRALRVQHPDFVAVALAVPNITVAEPEGERVHTIAEFHITGLAEDRTVASA